MTGATAVQPTAAPPARTARARGIPARAWAWYLGLSLGATMALVLIPPGGIAWRALDLAIGAASVGAMAWFIAAQRPRPLVPWLILESGWVAYVLWVVALVPAVPGPTAAPDSPSWTDAVLFAGSWLVAVAVLLIGRAMRAGRDPGELVESVILAVGVGSILWFLLVASRTANPTIPSYEKLVVLTYPLVELVLLAALGAIVLRIGWIGVGATLIVASFLVQVAAYVILAFARLDDTLGPASAAYPVYAFGFTLVGAGLLHPSAGILARSSVARSGFNVSPRVRLAALSVSAVLATVAAVADELLGLHDEGSRIVVVLAAVVVLLIVVRMWITAGELLRANASLTRAERELAERTRFLEQVTEATPGMVFSGSGSTFTLVSASSGVRTLLGYEPAEVVSTPTWWLDHVHPDDRDRFVAEAEASRRSGRPVDSFRSRILAADGTYRVIHSSVRHVGPADGPSDMVVGVALDVTDSSEAEARLRESEAFVADLIRTSPGMITRGCVETATVEYASAGAEGLLGYAPAEIIGVPGWLADHTHPDDLAVVDVIFGIAAGGGPRDAVGVPRVRTRAGEWRWLLTNSRVGPCPDGTHEWIANSLDITERVAMEEQLRAARDEAEAANRAKSEFLSLVSHEFRTPLVPILGGGQILEASEHLDPDDRATVADIVDAGRRLLELIDRVLDYARIDTGRLALSLGPVVVTDVVRRAVELVAPSAAEHRASIRDASGVDAGLEVRADGARLVLVLEDLVDNAVRHGGPDVTVTIDAARTADGHVAIRVRDNGRGMSKEQLTRAFAAFQPGGGGAALGLALARRLVDAMGGSLTVESALGEGTLVTLTLRAVGDDDVSATSPAVDATQEIGASA